MYSRKSRALASVRRSLRICIVAACTCAAFESATEPGGLGSLVLSGQLDDLRWPKFGDYQTAVREFYQSRAYAPAWIRDGAPSPQALALVAVLRNAEAKGLDPEDYDGSRWPARLARLSPSNPHPTDGETERFDLALTVSVMRYISDSSIGRVNPKIFCFGFDVESKKCNLVEVVRDRLINAADPRAVLEKLEPPFPGYRRIGKALQAYIAFARQDDGEVLPSAKKSVEPGDIYPGVARLERLLRLLGDIPPGTRTGSGQQVYGGGLVDAVKHFQQRHGIDPDGRIGAATLKQLNMPLSRRVRQLQLTLERWRWAPSEFAHPPVVINIPEFRLRAYNDRYEAELEMKVVVGRAYRRQTPVFIDEMTHIIFRPYWNVPLSIQKNELVPSLTKDPAYLGKNEYEVVNSRGEVLARDRVDGEILQQLRSGKLSIRQIPGAKNALGHIKLMFPNEYNVYLHGTPAKSLFARSRRDFSHGCIRVEKPEELAAWALRGQDDWTLERIREEEMIDKPPLQVNLKREIPVLVVYTTAVAREDGDVCFFEDIYKHDASLESLLSNGYPYSEFRPATSASRGPRPRE